MTESGETEKSKVTPAVDLKKFPQSEHLGFIDEYIDETKDATTVLMTHPQSMMAAKLKKMLRQLIKLDLRCLLRFFIIIKLKMQVIPEFIKTQTTIN